jgi:ankyrin repeat protein
MNMNFIFQSTFLSSALPVAGDQTSNNVIADTARAVARRHRERGRLPVIRRAVIASVCLLLSGCATFVQQPGTPLARAAHEGNLEAIHALIAAGADPNQYDATSQTPLHWAARGGHPLGPHHCRGEAPDRPDVVSALIDAGADINAVDRRAAIPGGSSGWSALHIAVHHEQFKTAARLLERGAHAGLRSRQGTSVLAMAADEGAPKELLQAIVARVY